MHKRSIRAVCRCPSMPKGAIMQRLHTDGAVARAAHDVAPAFDNPAHFHMGRDTLDGRGWRSGPQDWVRRDTGIWRGRVNWQVVRYRSVLALIAGYKMGK